MILTHKTFSGRTVFSVKPKEILLSWDFHEGVWDTTIEPGLGENHDSEVSGSDLRYKLVEFWHEGPNERTHYASRLPGVSLPLAHDLGVSSDEVYCEKVIGYTTLLQFLP